MTNQPFILEWGLVCKRMWVGGIVLFVVFLAADSRGIGYNPVGYGTAPVSGGVGSGRIPADAYGGGLVRSPNPVDGSGNLIITGNVRGGRYFRGIIPYQSPYSLKTDVPSSSLDSFLRDSAGSEDIGGGASKYTTQPYYSGTGTVATARPYNGGISRPVSTRVDDSASSKLVLPLLPKQEVPVREDTATPYTATNLRPLSMGTVELEQTVSDEIEAFSKSKKLADESHRPTASPLLRDLRAANDKVAELKQGLSVEDKLLQLPMRTEPNEEKIKKPETGVPGQVVGEGVSQSQEDVFGAPDVQVDIYEQMKRQINSVRRFLEQPAGAEQAKEEVKATEKTSGNRHPVTTPELFAADKAERETRRIDTDEEKQESTSSKELSLQLLPEGEAAELRQKTEDGRQNAEEKRATPQDVSQRRSNEQRETSKIVDAGLKSDVAAKAREILGEHKTFASFAEDKFNRHMRAAEEYLKRGRFYRAADAYTLASIYKPDDPLAYAGKSHALFAAGEYMSSALFLSRALEIFPEYAQFKIDLVAMVGDKDKLESRITNVEEWLGESGAAELQFLLGYIYYQMGRQAEAVEMINAAFEKMPESPAVVALKKAITEAVK